MSGFVPVVSMLNFLLLCFSVGFLQSTVPIYYKGRTVQQHILFMCTKLTAIEDSFWHHPTPKTGGDDLPVWMFLQHLVDADKERLVFKALHNAVLVDPKLGSCDSLALRNLRQIEFELLVVLLVRGELLVILNCRRKRKDKKEP